MLILFIFTLLKKIKNLVYHKRSIVLILIKTSLSKKNTNFISYLDKI